MLNLASQASSWAEFRAEFLEWLAANRPSAEEIEADPPRSSAYVPQWAATFTRRMFDDGWLVPGWPPGRGGRNAGPIETLVYLEELNKAEVPRTTNPQGLGIIAPSLLDYGTEEQIEKYAMPLLRGETSACLGMSEPDAGSDLANLKTRAVRDGDNFVINGQKVWTSGANYADFCFLFCRTDPDAPKHKGISIVLMPMNTPGVTVRPLNEIVSPEFPDLNEVFLDDVVLPVSNLVGEINNGGDMVETLLRIANKSVRVATVRAVKSKRERVAPIASGYRQGLVSHAAIFPRLESQMMTWDPDTSDGSPDRMDAMVWALTHLDVHTRSGGSPWSNRGVTKSSGWSSTRPSSPGDSPRV